MIAGRSNTRRPRIPRFISSPKNERVSVLAVAQISQTTNPISCAICIPTIRDVPHAHEAAADIPRLIVGENTT